MVDLAHYRHALAEAQAVAQGGSDADIKWISKVIPAIIARADAAAALDLVCMDSGNRDAWLPEALTLFGVSGLSISQKQAMVKSVFGVAETEADRLAHISASIGRYGFSFPQWRFPMQPYGGSSLAEQYGMQRLKRDTDLRDASLPDPQRDRLGTGFFWEDKNWYVEYRRAYIMIANVSAENPATLVIRNNSYLFGRDRISAPAYVSFKPMTVAQLQAVTEYDFANPAVFCEWQNVAKVYGGSLDNKLQRIGKLVGALDQFDDGLNLWLRSECATHPAVGPQHKNGGLPQLMDFLKQKLAANQAGDKGASLPFVGIIDQRALQWFPKMALPVTPEFIANASQILADATKRGERLVLLSGPQGDFPIAADKQAVTDMVNICRLDAPRFG